jgi:hypothetical protein
MTGLGILFLIALVALFIVPLVLPKELTIFKSFIFSNQFKLGLGSLGVLFIILGSSTIFAREGHKYYVLTPTGNRSVISNPGIKFVFPFSTIQEWEKYIDIKTIPVGQDGLYIESTEGIEGIIDIRLNGKVINMVQAPRAEMLMAA